jgi:hypothetical protein
MIRKAIYVLIAVTFVFAMDQLFEFKSQSEPIFTGPTGQVEVRLKASPLDEEVASVNITVSSVEVHLPNGWKSMELSKPNRFDLVQIEELEEVVAKIDLQQGTYNQIRVNISKVEVAFGDDEANKAKLDANRLTFTQNFTVAANRTSIILLYLDTEKSLDYGDGGKVACKPHIDLWIASSQSSRSIYGQTTQGSMLIMNRNLPNGAVGVPYFAHLSAFGGQTPYTWKITGGDLPDGLELDTLSGVILGTPTTAGNYGFAIRAKDDSKEGNNTTMNFRVGIADAGILQITTGSLPNNTENRDYHFQLEAIGGTEPYTWNLSSGRLPDGLELNPTTGLISGTPTAKGDYSFRIEVTDSNNPSNSDIQRFEIDIMEEIKTS